MGETPPVAGSDQEASRAGSRRVGRLVLPSLVVFGVAVALGGVALALRSPAPPVQPIAFSHLVHAGKFDLDCQYCHTGARRSSVAGVPPVSRCMGCHIEVATDHPEVQVLKGFWERQEPIPWQQIYDLPEFVRFSHKPHIRTEVQCSACHGQVAEMERVYRVTNLTMGWCLTCHQERAAPLDCLTCHY